jgi:hypothetical protein
MTKVIGVPAFAPLGQGLTVGGGAMATRNVSLTYLTISATVATAATGAMADGLHPVVFAAGSTDCRLP